MDKYELIGSKTPRVDASSKAAGEASYIDDLSLHNMLQGKILRSPYPHARISNIDVSRAKALPGVKAVITARDLPDIQFGASYIVVDQHPLAVKKVRHYMEGVAAVAAVDEDRAEEALNLIKVEYEPLPAVFDPLEAVQPGAPLIHEAYKNNISVSMSKTNGDIEKGFKESDYVREDTFRTAPQAQCPIEPHGCISLWERDGSLTHWCSHQRPFELQRGLARMVGLDVDRVRVILPAIGGGFGNKVPLYPHDIISAHLSRITGRPVKIVLSREEVFHATNQRHPTIITLKTGVKKDGTLICQSLRMVADGGAYCGTGHALLNIAHHAMLLPYKLQSCHFEGMRALTNKPIGGPYQGFGNPQVRFSVESQLDIIARELGLDPLDMRAKNFVSTGNENIQRQLISSCGLNECLEYIKKSLHWEERKGRLPEGRGLGVAFASSACSIVVQPHTPTGITIQINIDGGVSILSGGADIGQGMDTVVCQVVAQELGIGMESVRLTRADTANTPYDKGTFGTGGAFRLGNACLAAARETKKKLLEALAPRFETSPQDIEFGKGRVYVRGHYEKGVDFKEAIKIYQYAGRPMPLVALGSYEPEVADLETLIKKGGNWSPTYSFLGAGFEVEVEKETGEVKIIRSVMADDLGRVINKLGQEGQIEGALSKGIGMGLFEDLPHANGKYLNPTFSDYPLLTALDEPRINEIDWADFETLDPIGPYGAKSSAENAKGPVAPALANAIQDATGLRMRDLPITPEKIRKAMEEKR